MQEKEYEEIKDCTFQPRVINKAPEVKDVEIKGLGRVLELKEL